MSDEGENRNRPAWPLWWLIGFEVLALGEWVAGIAARLSQRLVDAYHWNREIWFYAYGVPWRWITDRLWRTPMFDQRPWHCLVCGGEWLPQGDYLSVFVQYGHFEGGTFRLYDEAAQVYGKPQAGRGPVRGWWTPFFGGLWYPRPGHAMDCVRFVHKWHFHKIEEADAPQRGDGRDCATGYLYKRRDVHPWHERTEYALRWTWAHMRGVAVFALLRFSIAWVRVWKWTPWRGHGRPASIFDGLCRRVVTNAPPWGWTPWRYVDRPWPDGSPVWRIRAWLVRARDRLLGFRYRVATFWQRRHAIWAAMPWPWHPVDGDPDGERRHIGEHLCYCWHGTGWWTPDETYFLSLGQVQRWGEIAAETFPGLDMVIDANHADAGTPCSPIDDSTENARQGLARRYRQELFDIQVDHQQKLIDAQRRYRSEVAELLGGRTLDDETHGQDTLTLTLDGVEVEAERLEGGALRVEGPGEDDA